MTISGHGVATRSPREAFRRGTHFKASTAANRKAHNTFLHNLRKVLVRVLIVRPSYGVTRYRDADPERKYAPIYSKGSLAEKSQVWEKLGP